MIAADEWDAENFASYHFASRADIDGRVTLLSEVSSRITAGHNWFYLWHLNHSDDPELRVRVQRSKNPEAMQCLDYDLMTLQAETSHESYQPETRRLGGIRGIRFSHQLSTILSMYQSMVLCRSTCDHTFAVRMLMLAVELSQRLVRRTLMETSARACFWERYADFWSSYRQHHVDEVLPHSVVDRALVVALSAQQTVLPKSVLAVLERAPDILVNRGRLEAGKAQPFDALCYHVHLMHNRMLVDSRLEMRIAEAALAKEASGPAT